MLLNNVKYKLVNDKIQEFFVIGFILTMPFKIQANSLLFILLLLSWLTSGHALSDLKGVLVTKLYQLYILLYFFYIAGVFYSSNVQEAFAEIELKISLILLPAILYSKVQLNNNRNRYLFTFVVACLIASVTSLLLLLYKIFFLGMYRHPDQPLHIDWVYFSYHLPKQISFHSPYFSMYTMVCVFILADRFLNRNRSNRTGNRIGEIFLLFFFFAFTVLLSSRTAIISGTAILFVSVLFSFLIRKRFIQAAVIVYASIALLSLLYQSTPYLKRKMEDRTGFSQRHQIWQASFELIKENPLIGVGTGDTKDKLEVKYSEMGLNTEAQRRLDPHNQYIQISLALGVSGLIIYIACLIYILYLSLRDRKYLISCFIVFYSFCGLTESVFTTQKGVILFSFITSTLAFGQLKKQAFIEGQHL